MKRRYKYTLIVELLGFIGSYIIYVCCTGRLDIWNLPENFFLHVPGFDNSHVLDWRDIDEFS